MFYNKLNKKIIEYQNELISKHCNEVENIYREMRSWRHDYHNHIQMMKAHIALGQVDELNAYFDTLEHDLKKIDKVIKTGNVMLDAILGSKISLAASKEIEINAKARVSNNLEITNIDLCVLMGNLLDNAIEACLSKKDDGHYEFEKPFIRIYIGMKGTHLYICVTNTVFGKVDKKGGKYISHKDKAFHGFGLMRIDKICSKYGGYCKRNNETGAFSTEILF